MTNTNKKPKSTAQLIREFLKRGGTITKVPVDPRFAKYIELRTSDFIEWLTQQEQASKDKIKNGDDKENK